MAPHLEAAEHRRQPALPCGGGADYRRAPADPRSSPSWKRSSRLQSARNTRPRDSGGAEPARTEAAETFWLRRQRQMGMHGFHDQSQQWQATPAHAPTVTRLPTDNASGAVVQAVRDAGPHARRSACAQMAGLLQQRERAISRGRSR